MARPRCHSCNCRPALTLTTTVLAFASGGVTLKELSKDPYTNKTSEHKTQVEPDTYSSGSTIVSAFQSGRFANGGASNIGWATSTNNGATWKHGFLPGIGVDKSTAGSSAHVTVLYYYFPNDSCNNSTCRLDVGTLSSIDGGSTWSSSTQVAGPMMLNWLANAGGYFVGDYFSVSFIASGKAYSVFAVATAPKRGKLNESMYTVEGGLPMSGGKNPSTNIAVYFGHSPAPAIHTAF